MTDKEKAAKSEQIANIATEARKAMVDALIAKVREYYDKGDVNAGEAIACHITATSMLYDGMLETCIEHDQNHSKKAEMKLAGELYTNVIVDTLRRMRSAMEG